MSFTRTDAIDYLYSSVNPNTIPELQDNIYRSRVLWAWLSESGRIKFISGGRVIEERLMYGKNTTVTSLGRGGQISLTPPDAITKSRWEWKYIAANMTRYWQDEHQSQGPDALADMVAENFTVTSESLMEELNRQAFADGTGNSGKDMDGLENIIAEDPTADTSVGGINGSTEPWWRNKFYDMSSDTFSIHGRVRMVTMYNDCTDGMQRPDLIITSQTLHELYETEIGNLQQVIPKEEQRNKIADLGFEALYFKRIPIFFDKDSPDATRMYFINSRALRLIADEAQWLSMTKWKEIPNQVNDKVAQLVIIANLVTNNRRRLGLLFNASG